ncbi:hypothetical protein ACLOJK_041277 [Asimina triloba]
MILHPQLPLALVELYQAQSQLDDVESGRLLKLIRNKGCLKIPLSFIIGKGLNITFNSLESVVSSKITSLALVVALVISFVSAANNIPKVLTQQVELHECTAIIIVIIQLLDAVCRIRNICYRDLEMLDTLPSAHWNHFGVTIIEVRNIPETFHSVEDYVESYVFPLLEETRAELYSSLETISDAPHAEITAIEESKHASRFCYFINVNGWKSGLGIRSDGIYKPLPGDIFILSSMIPEAPENLLQYGSTYYLAAVTDIEIMFMDEEESPNSDGSVNDFKSEESHNGLRIELSKGIKVAEGMGNSLYAIYLSNLTTNNRIWKALSSGIEVENKNLNMIKEVLYAKPLDMGACNACSFDETDIWSTKFYDDLISFNLNESQKDAVLNALSSIKYHHSHSFTLIWGPPGTGKTKSTSALLWVLLDMGCRTLTCAPTNVAVTQVCSRLLRIVKDHCRQDHESGFLSFSLGDVVLFGNKDRLLIDENLDIKDIFLEHRVDSLAECFAPASGWKHMILTLISLLEDCVPMYHSYLEDEKEKFGMSFKEFLRKRLTAIWQPLCDCMRLFSIHLTRTYISTNVEGNMVTLYNLLEEFIGLLCAKDISDKELEEIFSPERPEGGYSLDTDPSVHQCSASKNTTRMSLEKIRQECLHVLRVLKDTLQLPTTASKDYIKEFCLKNATLMFCTASASSSLQYYGIKPFQVLVIDEAAQLKECESVIPLRVKGIEHAILIGDEHQLPSTVNSKVSEVAGFGRSLFERLVLLGHKKHLLDIQYRMHPAISAFPNSKFYNGQILDGPNVTDARYENHYLQGPMYGPYSFINIFDGREERDEISKSWKNIVESKVETQMLVFDKARSIPSFSIVLGYSVNVFIVWESNGENLSVGVVCPYRAQVNAIQEKIANRYEQKDGFTLKIKSIDGFQGGEMDIIILSTVRSNSKGKVGFLDNLNRTNVALTRARHSLWILGNASTLVRSDSVWEELISDVKGRGHFFNADEDKGLAKAILQVKNELNQLEDLLNPDSVLLHSARWKVLFSDDFRKSFAKLKYFQVKQAVIQLLLRLADGWRPKSKSLEFPDSFQLAKQCRVKDWYLIWMVDILKERNYIQVLKVWDIVPLTEIPRLSNRLDNIFAMFTDAYIEHCKERSVDGLVLKLLCQLLDF